MEKKIIPLTKFVEDVSKYEQRHTLPRTWADMNENTFCYE